MTLSQQQLNDIEAQRIMAHYTRRTIAPGMEHHMYTPHEVLDHGFVRVVDYMGDDSAIVQAARVSYGEGTKEVSSDKGLIDYLMRHWHSTPFEMCEIKLHVKLPVFVARQWIRHRTANVNEYSARYSILEKEFYIPKREHLHKQSTTNGQGRGELLGDAEALDVQETLVGRSDDSYENYKWLLSEEGPELSRELARMNLPVNIYTQWYWKVDLHNLFHFLRLRADPHAQYEIRVYADAICKIIADWVPHAYAAFEEHRLFSQTFSRTEMTALRALIAGDADPACDMSARREAEFLKKLEGE